MFRNCFAMSSICVFLGFLLLAGGAVALAQPSGHDEELAVTINKADCNTIACTVCKIYTDGEKCYEIKCLAGGSFKTCVPRTEGSCYTRGKVNYTCTGCHVFRVWDVVNGECTTNGDNSCIGDIPENSPDRSNWNGCI